jgi:hypothetical protein
MALDKDTLILVEKAWKLHDAGKLVEAIEAYSELLHR